MRVGGDKGGEAGAWNSHTRPGPEADGILQKCELQVFHLTEKMEAAPP